MLSGVGVVDLTDEQLDYYKAVAEDMGITFDDETGEVKSVPYSMIMGPSASNWY